MSNEKPIDVVQDGNLKANIWKNEGENGPFYNVTLTKTYKDDRGNYQNTNNFSGTDLLRVAELSRKAYGRSNEIRREQYQAPEHDSGDLPDRAGASREFDRSRTRNRPRPR